MNIGGKDIQLLGRGLNDDVEVIARYFFQWWPDMLVEQPDTTHRYDASQEPLSNWSETYLYRDQATFERIQAEGVTEELENYMVTVIRDGTAITLVIGLDWDVAPLIAYFYRTADEQVDPSA